MVELRSPTRRQPPACFTGRRADRHVGHSRLHRPGFRQSTCSSHRPVVAIDIATANSIQPTAGEDERAAGRSSCGTRRAGATPRPATASVAVLEQRRVIHPVVARTGSRPRPVRIAGPLAGPRRRSPALRPPLGHAPACVVLRYAISLLVASHCIPLRLCKLPVLRPGPSGAGNILLERRATSTSRFNHAKSRPHRRRG